MSETTQKVAELKKSLSTGPVALSPSRFAIDAAFAIQTSYIELPRGVSLDDALRPEFWAHIAHKLKPRSRILVDAEDGSFSAMLKVHSASRLEAIVTVEWRSEAAPVRVAMKPEDAFDVHYVGTKAKWRISRKSDGKTISDGWENEEIARNELRGYLQALAA